MASRTSHRLSPRRIEREFRRGRYADGGGLYLQVSEQGAKSWLFRFMQDGKARQMGLGAVQTISLSEARKAALNCRKRLHMGIDPIEARKKERTNQRTHDTNMNGHQIHIGGEFVVYRDSGLNTTTL